MASITYHNREIPEFSFSQQDNRYWFTITMDDNEIVLYFDTEEQLEQVKDAMRNALVSPQPPQEVPDEEQLSHEGNDCGLGRLI